MNQKPKHYYRICVDKFGTTVNVGPPYRTKKIAQGWVSFVKSAWHGLPTWVEKFDMPASAETEVPNAG